MDVQESLEVKSHRSRAIYLFPNLFTTACLFCGFYSVVAAMKHHFDIAAIVIFIAMVADGLDGRVARLINAQSAFGGEYDSLADMVAFGIAPSLVVYTWSLYSLGKLGWLAAFFYAVSTALRLARFNTQLAQPDKRYFHGLPCPSAAGFIAGMIWIQQIYEIQGPFVNIVNGLLMVMVGILMVSNIKYRSFKDFDSKGKSSYFTFLGIIVIFICVVLAPSEVLFSVFALYVFSGPAAFLKKHFLNSENKEMVDS